MNIFSDTMPELPKIAEDPVVPELISRAIEQRKIASMDPGEYTSAVLWMVGVDEKGNIRINTSCNREEDRGGTSRLSIIRDFQGFYIDATAVGIYDLLDVLQHNPEKQQSVPGIDTDDNLDLIGVIYPHIESLIGSTQQELAAFNGVQSEYRIRFAKYYRSTYGRDYHFAGEGRDSRYEFNDPEEVVRHSRLAITALDGFAQDDANTTDTTGKSRRKMRRTQ